MVDRRRTNVHRSYPTVTLLLLAVNGPLVVLVSLLLVTDYRREMGRAIDARRITLSDEAGLIGTALLQLSDPDDGDAIKSFLESSCAATAGPGTPGHWIDVRWNGRQLHTHTGPQHSGDLSNRRSAAISGRFSANELRVEVSELAADIRRGVRGEVLVHVSWLLTVAALAALIVDIVLVRLIAGPTKRLAAWVNQLGSERFDMQPQLFRSRELNELSREISSMAGSLHAAQSSRATAMKRAEQIQQHLLPKNINVPGLSIVSHFQPAEEVAGDIYDVMKMQDGSWLIYVADLVGHGIPAAMSASILKMVIESAAVCETDPGEMMGRVNRKLPRYLSEDGFATAIILRWQPELSELTFASAGHEPILILRETTLESLEATGLPLGVDVTLQWTTETIQLRAGDRFLLCTDGICEASDEMNQMFGRTQIQQMMRDHRNTPIKEFVSTMVQRINQHIGDQPAQDDITLLVAQCDGSEKTLEMK